MSVARSLHVATLLADGKVLVTEDGGMNSLSGAELYDPATESWAVTGAMSTVRYGSTATLLATGKVLVAGGFGVTGGYLMSSELYDPVTGSWAATGVMTFARSNHTATLLPNGNVVCVGGVGTNGSHLSSAEQYDSGLLTLTQGATEHGTITGNASPYVPDTTSTLTATPRAGYVFAGWTGDATGNANPLAVLMDADKAIGATFSPDTNDSDGDGLTNYQEIVEYGTNPTLPDTDGDGVNDKKDAFPLDPAETLDTDHDGTGDNADLDDDNDSYSDADETNIHHTNPNLADTDNDGLPDGEEFTTYHTNPLIGDTDGDGFLDGYEVLTGKSPVDPLDKPALVAEARTAIEFTFPAAVGKTYRIESSTDLADWEIVETGIAGTGGEIQRFYSTRNQPKRYFRVEEETP
jgi:uncharacterized repeat protein (TIGR02543 family)